MQKVTANTSQKYTWKKFWRFNKNCINSGLFQTRENPGYSNSAISRIARLERFSEVERVLTPSGAPVCPGEFEGQETLERCAGTTTI